MSLPLSVILLNRALETFLPSAKRGAVKSMTNFCHWPGSFEALTLGGFAQVLDDGKKQPPQGL